VSNEGHGSCGPPRKAARLNRRSLNLCVQALAQLIIDILRPHHPRPLNGGTNGKGVSACACRAGALPLPIMMTLAYVYRFC
jgi:hypothetical protein